MANTLAALRLKTDSSPASVTVNLVHQADGVLGPYTLSLSSGTTLFSTLLQTNSTRKGGTVPNITAAELLAVEFTAVVGEVVYDYGSLSTDRSMGYGGYAVSNLVVAGLSLTEPTTVAPKTPIRHSQFAFGDLSNQVLILLAGAGVWDKSDKAASAFTDATTVGHWQDQSANGKYYNQPTDASRPTYNIGTTNGIEGGYPAISFSGSKVLVSGSNDVLSPITSTAGYSIYLLHSVGTSATIKVMFGTGTSSFYLGHTAPNGADTITVWHSQANAATWGRAADAYGNKYPATIVTGVTCTAGTSIKHFRNLAYLETDTDTAPTTTGNSTIGAEQGGTTYLYDGKIGGILVFKGAHDETTRQRVTKAIMSLASPSKGLVTVHGNSHTTGYGLSGSANSVAGGQDYVYKAWQSLGGSSALDVLNFSTAGIALDAYGSPTMTSEFQKRIGPCFHPGRPFNILVVDEVTNQIKGSAGTGSDLATLQASTTAYVNAARAIGWQEIVWCTARPRKSSESNLPATAEATRLAYNSWIRRNYKALGITELCDLAALPECDVDTDCTDTAWFQSDGIHGNVQLHNLWSVILANCLRNARARLTSSSLTSALSGSSDSLRGIVSTGAVTL